ncbi:MAG: T9SS type A sorting domain-containing protein, partial [Bacteroidota bacterium]
TITFTIPAAQVSIFLLDSQGRQIKKIAEGYYTAGTHHAVFERDGLPSGNYFYTLRVNGMSVTRKLLLL